MHFPDYSGGSIVHLMSTICRSFGGRPAAPQIPLHLQQRVILLVIDALGYSYIRKYGRSSVFVEHLSGKLDSVFPPTTAAAITTLQTGLAPQQHGISGWYMYLREANRVATVLPFVDRATGKRLRISRYRIFDQPALDTMFSASSALVMPSRIRGSHTCIHARRTTERPYATLPGMFRQARASRAAYTYAYWPAFDSLCHEFGPDSSETRNHFHALDAATERFLRNVPKHTSVIITADHGITAIRKTIFLEEHPELRETLRLPLAGERRSVYCSVFPEKREQFVEYVQRKLKPYCTLLPSRTLLQDHRFGPGRAHPELKYRIGDYTLLMKEHYALKDVLPGEDHDAPLGHHGGVSREEMEVPLITYQS